MFSNPELNPSTPELFTDESHLLSKIMLLHPKSARLEDGSGRKLSDRYLDEYDTQHILTGILPNEAPGQFEVIRKDIDDGPQELFRFKFQPDNSIILEEGWPMESRRPLGQNDVEATTLRQELAYLENAL